MSNLYTLFAEAAAAAGDRPVFVDGDDVRLRYSQLDAEVASWSAALAAMGARPNDRILVQAEKSVESALLYLASLRAGLVGAAQHRLPPAEVAAFVADAGGDRRPRGAVDRRHRAGTRATLSPIDRGGDDLAALAPRARPGAEAMSATTTSPPAWVLKDYWHWRTATC